MLEKNFSDTYTELVEARENKEKVFREALEDDEDFIQSELWFVNPIKKIKKCI